MIKFRKSKIVAAAVAGLILAGTVGTVAMAGSNSNGGNLLSRCRNMLCVENGVCVNGNQQGVICGSAPQCGGEGFQNETGSGYDSHQRYCENRGNDGYHHGDFQNHGGRHGEHH